MNRENRKHTGFAIAAFTDGDGNAATLEQLGADIALSVPFDHCPTEEGLKKLLGEFLKENLIVFPDNKETYEKLKNIQRSSNLQNLYIVDSDNLSKNIFMLSSLIFSDEFKDVVKSLESLEKRQVFHTSIRAKDDFLETLNAVADEKTLEPYATVVVFGGKDCKPEDVDTIRAYFEKNSNIEFTYFDGRQHDSDFIIGAY